MTDSVFPEHVDLTLAGGPIRLYSAGPADGEPILLLHGAMLATAEINWLRVVPGLAENYRVHAIDLPRHGASRPWPGVVDQQLCERVLRELIEHLSVARIPLIGLSLGGGISIGFALRHPELVSALVLAAPGGLGAKRPAQFLTWLVQRTPMVLRWLTKYLASSKTAIEKSMRMNLTAGADTPDFGRIVELCRAEAEAKAAHKEKSLDDWQIVAYGPRRMTLDFLPSLTRLETPALWLRGADDPLVKAAELAQAAATAPRSSAVTIAEAQHLSPLDQPERFLELVGEFLAAQGIR